MVVQVLFAYLYDWRTMGFESSCETAWTVNKLCAGLSGFVYFKSTHDSLVSLFRRAMVYPIYRHFELCKRVQADLVDVMRAGRCVIALVLLHVHVAF